MRSDLCYAALILQPPILRTVSDLSGVCALGIYCLQPLILDVTSQANGIRARVESETTFIVDASMHTVGFHSADHCHQHPIQLLASYRMGACAPSNSIFQPRNFISPTPLSPSPTENHFPPIHFRATHYPQIICRKTRVAKSHRVLPGKRDFVSCSGLHEVLSEGCIAVT